MIIVADITCMTILVYIHICEEFYHNTYWTHITHAHTIAHSPYTDNIITIHAHPQIIID